MSIVFGYGDSSWIGNRLVIGSMFDGRVTPAERVKRWEVGCQPNERELRINTGEVDTEPHRESVSWKPGGSTPRSSWSLCKSRNATHLQGTRTRTSDSGWELIRRSTINRESNWWTDMKNIENCTRYSYKLEKEGQAFPSYNIILVVLKHRVAQNEWRYTSKTAIQPCNGLTHAAKLADYWSFIWVTHRYTVIPP